MNDDETILRVLEGDADCFGLLVEKYQKKIVGMIYNMTRDYHLSEDLGQEVFMEVYRSLRSFDDARSRFSTWLYRIAQNKTLNAIKKKKPIFLPEVPEMISSTDAYREVVADELHAELDRVLDGLPIKQRMAFVWAEIEQLSYQEIAEIEGVSLGTVKSRINGARKRIQEALKNRKESLRG
jgi:RNA polymerase sigma-70 factor, ECF subfamily